MRPQKITVLYFSVASQWLGDWEMCWSIDVFKTPFSSHSLSLLIIEIRFLVSKLSKFCGEELVIVNQIHDPLGLYISLDYTMPWILELPKQCMILRWSVWGLGLNISISNFIDFVVWQEVKGATSSINSICWTIPSIQNTRTKIPFLERYVWSLKMIFLFFLWWGILVPMEI